LNRRLFNNSSICLDNTGNSATDKNIPSEEPGDDGSDEQAGEQPELDVEVASDTTTAPAQTIKDVVRAAREEFGEHLPEGTLNEEEYKIYERLYGPPRPVEDVQETDSESAEIAEPERDPALFKKAEDGSWEEIDHVEQEELDLDDVVLSDETTYQDDLQAALDSDRSARKERKESQDDERLQRDIAAAMSERKERTRRVPSDDTLSQLMEDMHAEYAEENTSRYHNQDEFVRTHPFTTANRFSTSPSTLQIPYNDMVAPVSSLLSKLSNKHLDEAAAAAFGGPALPYATGSPLSSKILPQKPIPLGPGQNRMTEMEADVYTAAIMPGAFAVCTSILIELRKRLGSGWLPGLLQKEGGPRVLDVGAGGAGVIAWREVLKAEWMRMHNIEPPANNRRTRLSESEDDGEKPRDTVEHVNALKPAVPYGKATVLTSSPALQQRASILLENTTFLPRLPDYVHAQLDPDVQRKQYDVIVAPYSLWHIAEGYERRQRVLNLWSLLDPNGGVLILLEKGVPRGFEVIADARQYLLGELFEGGKEAMNRNSRTATETSILDGSDGSPSDDPNASEDLRATLRSSRRAPGRILAPCTNHNKCPMYLIPGVSRQRKDWCHFQQRYIRPPYLQRLLGGKDRNHEDVNFSYVAVQKGVSFDIDNEGRKMKRGDPATDRAFEGYEIGDAELATNGSASTPTPTATSTDVVTADTSPSQITNYPNSLSLPRLVFPPLKKPGHIILDVCTPSGTLERWSVPRSYGKQAYHDARKSKWGDLWALGARQRQSRRVRLGKEHLQHGLGVGRGMQSYLKAEEQDVRETAKRTKKPAQDVKGRSRTTMLGEGEEDALSGKEKRVQKVREQKVKGREKARQRRRQETKELFRGVE